MKIRAPGLSLDMAVRSIALADGSRVVSCRTGPYDATAQLSRDDVRVLMRTLFRPALLIRLVGFAFGKPR
jgi:hypothetical protein